MKALAKLTRAPGLALTEVKKPEVGHNDVMIRIRKTAICGTDIHIWKWDDWAQKTIPVPMQVGHEYVGEVVEMGILPSPDGAGLPASAAAGGAAASFFAQPETATTAARPSVKTSPENRSWRIFSSCDAGAARLR